MILPSGVGSAKTAYQGPTDSISLKYGNGYNMCGSRTYTLLNNAGNPLKSDTLLLSVKTNANRADDLSIALDTLAQGKEFKIDV